MRRLFVASDAERCLVNIVLAHGRSVRMGYKTKRRGYSPLCLASYLHALCTARAQCRRCLRRPQKQVSWANAAAGMRGGVDKPDGRYRILSCCSPLSPSGCILCTIDGGTCIADGRNHRKCVSRLVLRVGKTTEQTHPRLPVLRAGQMFWVFMRDAAPTRRTTRNTVNGLHCGVLPLVICGAQIRSFVAYQQIFMCR